MWLQMGGTNDGRREQILVSNRGSVDYLIESADALSELLESAANAKGLKHRRHQRVIAPARRNVEAVMRSYFARQESALLAEIKPKIGANFFHAAERRAKGHLIEAARDGQMFADALMPTSIAPLRMPVASVEDSEYGQAIRDAILGAAKTLAKELSIGTVISDDVAARYLRDNSLTKLTGGFSATSIQRLRDAIAEAWDAGGSYDSIVEAIQETFAQFSDVRSGLIAQTEINDAYVFGRMELAREAGMEQKAWSPDGTDACEICLGNIDDGWIGLEDAFSSGDLAPTAHPNCDCSVDFRKGAPEE